MRHNLGLSTELQISEKIYIWIVEIKTADTKQLVLIFSADKVFFLWFDF